MLKAVRQSAILNMLHSPKVCTCCDSVETYIRPNGLEQWYNDGNGGRLCHKCYKKNIEYPDRGYRRLRFKDRRIVLDVALRIGVCNWCRAVVPFDCKLTHMHHERYNPDNPKEGTIEVCITCHHKETHRLQREANGEPSALEERRCFKCNGSKTYLDEGKWPKWYRIERTNNYLCKTCYDHKRRGKKL